jgi:hypothetical protein
MTAVWTRVNTLLLLLALLMLGAILGVLAARIEGGPLDPSGSPSIPTDSVQLPGRPITGPTLIDERGHYYLTRNINSGLAAPIIVIAQNNVTLDLNGFTLGGGDISNSTGIYIQSSLPEFENIVIRNGTVRDFRNGIDAAAGVRVRLEDVHVISNHRGVQLGTQSSMSECTVAMNSEHGIVLLAGTFASTIENCHIGPNAANGVNVGGSDVLITDSYITGNQGGLDVNLLGHRNVIRDSYLGEINITGQKNVVMDNACVKATSNGGGITNIISPADHPNINCPP